MKRGQLLIVVFAVIAVAAVALFSAGGDDGGDDGGGDGGDGPAAPQGSIGIPFAYSPEKEKLLVPLIRRFNQERIEVGGKPVFVEGEAVASGEAESKIASGELEPVVWSPASSLWGRLLNFEADQQLAAEESPSIVRTPLVIAMWEPFAQALGWPDKQIGFEQIIRLARSNQGFAEFGRPEFGRFKLVHTNPDYSTSGLEAVVAEYYAATGKKEGLTEQDVEGSAARRIVRDIERSIVHYGDTTLFIADQMRKEGPGYASAVAMEEVTLLDFNKNRGAQPKLVALYPPEGTFYSDNPFIVLNGPWVSAAQRRGAERFGDFLADGDHTRAGRALGLSPGRPGDRGGAPGVQGERSRPRPAGARARPARAAHPRPHPPGLARGSQTGQRAARGRHVRLDARREPPGAGQGGAEDVLRARWAARTAWASRSSPTRSSRCCPWSRLPRASAACATRSTT